MDADTGSEQVWGCCCKEELASGVSSDTRDGSLLCMRVRAEVASPAPCPWVPTASAVSVTLPVSAVASARAQKEEATVSSLSPALSSGAHSSLHLQQGPRLSGRGRWHLTQFTPPCLRAPRQGCRGFAGLAQCKLAWAHRGPCRCARLGARAHSSSQAASLLSWNTTVLGPCPLLPPVHLPGPCGLDDPRPPMPTPLLQGLFPQFTCASHSSRPSSHAFQKCLFLTLHLLPLTPWDP